MSNVQTPEYYGTGGAARECDVVEKTIYRWIERGELHAIRASNGFRLIHRNDLEALKARRAAGLMRRGGRRP
jgi:excisionase family DNA binding protein